MNHKMLGCIDKQLTMELHQVCIDGTCFLVTLKSGSKWLNSYRMILFPVDLLSYVNAEKLKKTTMVMNHV